MVEEVVKWMTWGRAALYFSLIWTLYFGVKSLWEARKHLVEEFKGCYKEDDKSHHRKAHILYLLAAFGVCFFIIFGYLWFDVKDTGLGYDDRTVGVFLIFFVNLYLAFTINHFKAERLGKPETGSWREILKF